MKQEDLEAIRADPAERTKQDAAKKAVGKAKRGRPKATTQADVGQAELKWGRKRKNPAAEEDDAKKAEADVLKPPAKMARISKRWLLQR